MPVAGPFYFAWVDATDTTFGVAHHRMDEYIYSARKILSEGEKPLLEIVIKNPHVGILSSGRKYWAWFAWFNGTSIVPQFFGRVVGQPSDVLKETLTIQIVSWPIDYVQQVQRVAETLKYAPFWDPVAIDPAKRDDPDKILETHFKLWDVNPITLAVTANDLMIGQDGNVDFTGDDHFYDSMNMTLGQPPLTAVLMDATVNWTQTARGHVDMGNQTFFSYAGDGIISEWPKPLQSLQSGWSVAHANAVDALGITNALTASFGDTLTNPAKTHADGDFLTYTWSVTVPQIPSGLEGLLTYRAQSGVLDPFAVDSDGDPAPLNIPASVSVSKIHCPKWQVNTSLVLRYDAERQRSERIIFMVQSDLQPTIVDPSVSQDSETITVSLADVGVPILNLHNWTTIAGTLVAVGDVIFPDNPSLPGGRSAQIATVAGTAGLVQPNFSDVVGTPTVDGGVTWVSLGNAAPTESARDWTGISVVPLGTIIAPRQPFWTTWVEYTQPGRSQVPVVGVSVSTGLVVQAPGGSYQICTLSGTTQPTAPAFSATWGVVTTDGNAEWTSLGMQLPTGTNFFIATQAGTTGPQYIIPPFNNALHATTTDGTVVWKSIGAGNIPIGGTPGNVTARSYFPANLQTVEYLISKCRAKLLWRARCVAITFSCEYHKGLALTVRKTATLHDPRIAGGLALGKIKSVEMSADGNSGTFICHVTLACMIGYGNAVTAVPGSPTYVTAGYVQSGYQAYTGVIKLLPVATDVGYTPPVQTTTDDGLVFPLDRAQIVVSEQVHGTLAAQATAVLSAFASAAKAAQLASASPTNIVASLAQQNASLLARANSVGLALQRNPIWYDLQIKPVNAGPFNAVYNVVTTRLVVPQHVDLQSDITT